MVILRVLIVLFSLFFYLNASDNSNKYHIYKNLDYLDLSTNQVDKLKEVLIKYQIDYKKYHKKKKREEKKLKELILKDKFNDDTYEESLEEIYEELIKLETNFIENIHSILTPIQRRKFSKHFREWRVD